jgi:DNA-binding transcriptional ArsR family regulator
MSNEKKENFVKGLIGVIVAYTIGLGCNKKLMKLIKEVEELDILIKKYDKIFKNPKRKEILSVLEKKELNMKEISNLINLSYKNTINHIYLLEEYGFLLVKNNENVKGREVIVKLKVKNKEEIVNNLKKKLDIKVKEMNIELADFLKNLD